MTVHQSDYFKGPTVARTAVGSLPVSAYNGIVKCAYAKYTAGSATLAQNDYIELFDLPAYAIPHSVKYVFGAFGSSVTLDIGDIELGSAATVDENKFESAVDVSSASASAGFLAVDDTAPNDQPTRVRAKLEGADPADTTGVDLEVWMLYVEAS